MRDCRGVDPTVGRGLGGDERRVDLRRRGNREMGGEHVVERGDRSDVLVDRLRRRMEELTCRSHAVTAGEAGADVLDPGIDGDEVGLGGCGRRRRPTPSRVQLGGAVAGGAQLG